MSIASDILTADVLAITLEVWIANQLVPDVLGVDTAAGFLQDNSTAQPLAITRPSWAEAGSSVIVKAGYNGVRVPIHAGEISGFTWKDEETGHCAVAVDSRDALYKARKAYKGDDITFSATHTDGAIVTMILAACGITAVSIEDSGWIPCVVQDITLTKGDIPYSLIERLDFLSGYRTYARADGRIYRTRSSGAPAPTPAWTATEGVDILSIDRRKDAAGAIYSGAIFTGLAWEGVAVSGEAFATGPGDVKTEQDDFLQTDDDATNAAQTFVADHNREAEEGLELTLIGNPLLQPGQTIKVVHSKIEQGESLTLLDTVRHSIRDASFTTTITTTGGNLSGYNASAPQPAIDLQFISEAEDGVFTIMVLASAAGSFSPGYPETDLGYSWTLTAVGGTLSPDTGTGVIIRAVGPSSITSVTAEVTITDPDALSATLSVTKAVTNGTLLREDLWACTATELVYLPGERDPVTATLPGGATIGGIAAKAGPTFQVACGSDGHLYASFDYLATPVVDLGQPFGDSVALTACYVGELDPSRLWVLNADGGTAFGELDLDAQTASWAVLTALPEGPGREIREAYTYGSLRAAAGASYYASEDGGNSWALVFTFDTAWRLAAGWEEQLASGLNDPDPLRSEAGSTITLPALTPAVTHIRGVSFGWNERELYAVDDLARLLLSDGALLTLAHVLDGPTGYNHMERSGHIDGKVYLAGDDGAYAWIPAIGYLARIYDSGASVLMVGYGGFARPQPNVMLIVSAVASASPGGIWLYSKLTGWVLKNSGLPSGYEWQIAADPHNPNRWLLLATYGAGAAATLHYGGGGSLVIDGTTDSPLWMTEDLGESFAPVSVDNPSWSDSSYGFYIQNAVFDWSTADTWRLVVATGHPPGPAGSATIVWGSGTGTTRTLATTAIESGVVTALNAGDTYISWDPYKAANWIEATGTSLHELPTGFNTNIWVGAVEKLRGSSRGVVIIYKDGATLGGTEDYSVDTLTDRLAGTGNYLATAADGSVYIGGRGYNVQIGRVADPLGAPVLVDVGPALAAVNEAVLTISVGRQQGVAVAGQIRNSTGTVHDFFVSSNGTNWSRLAGPGVAVGAAIEVLEA